MTITIPKIILTKLQQEALIVTLMLIATGGLYTASTHQQQIDPYKLDIQQRTQIVDNLMKTVHPGSSMHDLKNVQDGLRLQAIWAQRTKTTLNPEQLKIESSFETHINKCNAVLISFSKNIVLK